MRKILSILLVIGFLFIPTHSFAAYAVAGTNVEATGIAISSKTFAWNNSASATILICTVEASGAGASVSSITYNSVNLTNAVAVNTNGNSEIWYLLLPSAGSNNVVVTLGATANWFHSTCSGWTGNASSLPVGITGTQNSVSAQPSISVTTQQANSIIVDAFAGNGEVRTLTVTSPQTVIFQNTVDGKIQGASYKTTTTAGSYTMSWSVGGGDVQLAYAVAEFKEPSAAPSATLEGVVLFTDF